MIDEETRALYARAIRHYGLWGQTMKFAEECSEASAAAIRRLSNPSDKTTNELLDEAADVAIMGEQMRMMYGGDAIDAIKAYKLARLKARLDEVET